MIPSCHVISYLSLYFIALLSIFWYSSVAYTCLVYPFLYTFHQCFFTYISCTISSCISWSFSFLIPLYFNTFLVLFLFYVWDLIIHLIMEFNHLLWNLLGMVDNLKGKWSSSLYEHTDRLWICIRIAKVGGVYECMCICRVGACIKCALFGLCICIRIYIQCGGVFR